MPHLYVSRVSIKSAYTKYNSNFNKITCEIIIPAADVLKEGGAGKK